MVRWRGNLLLAALVGCSQPPSRPPPQTEQPVVAAADAAVVYDASVDASYRSLVAVYKEEDAAYRAIVNDRRCLLEGPEPSHRCNPRYVPHPPPPPKEMDGGVYPHIERVNGGLRFDVNLDLPVFKRVDDWYGVFLAQGEPIAGSGFQVVRGGGSHEHTFTAVLSTSSAELPSMRVRIYNPTSR